MLVNSIVFVAFFLVVLLPYFRNIVANIKKKSV